MITERLANLDRARAHPLERTLRRHTSVLMVLSAYTSIAVPATAHAVDSDTPPQVLAANASETSAASGTGQSRAQAGPSDRRRIEEVVVTARKRAERIEDVPLSIAVIGTDEIDRRGLLDAEYLRGVPGVNQVTERLGQSIVIRGMETSPSAQNFASGTTVATYFGETPTTSAAGITGGTNVDLKLVDIERVEVLRGPQGTAFGSSSLGGAVRTIPVPPKADRVEGLVSGSYSATSGGGGDNYLFQAAGNLPLVQDKIAIRAVGYQYEDSGFYRNRAGSDPAFQATAAALGAQAFATDEDEVGAATVSGGRAAVLFQATNDIRLTFSYLTQTTEVDGQAHATSGPFEQTLLQVAPEQVVRGQKGGLSDTDIDIANTVVEYDFGWANLLGTYSYVKSGSMYVLPLPQFGALSDRAESDHRENSGEIRLSTHLQGAWNFLVGLYAEDLEDKSVEDYRWYGDPTLNRFGPELLVGLSRHDRNLKQTAAFGEVAWEFLPAWTLTGGIRAFDYERATRSASSGRLLGNGSGVFGPELVSEASGTSFRANLSYKPSEDTLIYAGWSQGFRLGRATPGLPAGLCDRDSDGVVDGTGTTIEQTKKIDSDDVDSFEIGTKLALLDRRLTILADIYYLDWTGVPFLVIAPPPCNLGYTANAGSARSRGVELQANFYLTEKLRADLGGSWIDAELTTDVPGQSAFDGDRLPGSPKVNASLGLQYEFDIGGHEAFVRADSTYVGSFFGTLPPVPQTEAGDYVKVDATARVAVNNLSVDLFVRNLTNADDYSFRGIRAQGELWGYRLRPRTVGLQLGYRF